MFLQKVLLLLLDCCFSMINMQHITFICFFILVKTLFEIIALFLSCILLLFQKNIIEHI